MFYVEALKSLKSAVLHTFYKTALVSFPAIVTSARKQQSEGFL